MNLTDQYKTVTKDLVQRMLNLEKWRRDVTGNSPLFDVGNEHTPATLTANQNDYDPGFYDVLRVNATQNITVTGIARGQKGRFLEWYNVSNYKFTFPNESGSSLAANRIINSSGQNVVLFPTGRVRMYYDSTLMRWVIPDPPSWTGTYGISVRAYVGAGLQAISDDGADHKLLLDTVNPGNDEWGLFDAINNRIVVPTGMSGLWVGSLKGWWSPHATGGNDRRVTMQVNGAATAGQSAPSIAGVQQWMNIPIGEVLVAGDILTFHARQVSGGNLNYNFIYIHLAKVGG